MPPGRIRNTQEETAAGGWKQGPGPEPGRVRAQAHPLLGTRRRAGRGDRAHGSRAPGTQKVLNRAASRSPE